MEEATPRTGDRNLMTMHMAIADEQIDFFVRWAKTFALGTTQATGLSFHLFAHIAPLLPSLWEND